METNIIAASAIVWVVRLPVILFAITVHEYAHGRIAYFFGDPTAKMSGRLTFNPFSHLDLMGAACFLLVGFGWAKPVPVDPRYFRNPRRDNVLVSLAGPAANILVAICAGLILRMLPWHTEHTLMILSQLVLLDVAFALFNLLPIAPLDGSHVVEGLLPIRQAILFNSLSRYGPFILIGLLLFDNMTNAGIMNAILGYPILLISYFLGGDGMVIGLHLLNMLN